MTEKTTETSIETTAPQGKPKKKKHPVWRAIKIILFTILCMILAVLIAACTYVYSKFRLMKEDTFTGIDNTEISGELYETDGEGDDTLSPGGETGGASGEGSDGTGPDSSGESGVEPGTDDGGSGASGDNGNGGNSVNGSNSGGNGSAGGNTGGNGGNGSTGQNGGSAGGNSGSAETMNPEYADLETRDAVEATGEVVAKKQIFNILLIGSDERTNSYSSASRSDTCILLSINTMGDTPKISLVSFQRDMAVLVQEGSHAGQWDKLNHTFQYGGAEQLMRQIEYSFKVDVDYYVRVNFNVFEKGIDYIGGVDVYMDEKEVTYFHDGHISSDVFVGTNRLNGKLALAYARLREIDSDWARLQRQREVIVAALQQVKGMSFGEIDSMINTLLPMVRTNLSEWKVAQLMWMIPSIMKAEVQQLSIPAKGTYGMMPNTHLWMLSVDFAANAEILHEFLYGE